MPLLYYWRGDNYRRDLDCGVGYHLNQANPLLHEVELGDMPAHRTPYKGCGVRRCRAVAEK